MRTDLRVSDLHWNLSIGEARMRVETRDMSTLTDPSPNGWKSKALVMY
jgi:hypothetical protein